MKEVFSGVCTALITPFDKNNNIDYLALQNLIEYQLSNNVDAILILGTTGESCTISTKERFDMVQFCKNIIQDRCKLIVGVGSNNTAIALEYIDMANRCSVDACLAVTPYYNKCTQGGAYWYYKKLSEHSKAPIIVYNVPSRTGFDIKPATMQQISLLPNVAGIKEASQDVMHILDVFRLCKNNVAIYSGNDNLNGIFASLGAKGTISVSSNVYPKIIKQTWQNSNVDNDILFNFNNIIFAEPNPIPIKYAVSKLGLCKNIVREPLTNLTLYNKKLIDKEMQKIKEQTT